MNPIRVLIIADDHPVVQRGLRGMLADADEVEIVGEAYNAREAIERAASLCPYIPTSCYLTSECRE